MNYSKLNKTELISIIKRLESKDIEDSRNLFLSNISHDVRTLLNAIYGNAQILAQDEDLTNDQQHNVERILEASTHMIDLINNIITMSKNSSDDKIIWSEFNLTELLDTIYSIFKTISASKNIDFILDTHLENSFIIKSDKTKLFYILLNLVGNAIKYTNKGSVTISCEIQEKTLDFRIIDTGVGLDESKISELSQEYARGDNVADTQGFGLGLGIVNKNLALLNATLEIKSQLQKGSIFSFSIKSQHNTKFESTQENIFEIKKIKNIIQPEGFTVLVYIKDNFELPVLKSYFLKRNIQFEFIHQVDILEKELKKPFNKMIFIEPNELTNEELKFFKNIKNSDLSIPLISLTSSVMSHELTFLNQISTTYIIQPYHFIDIDQVLIIFSNQEFEYYKEEKEVISNKLLIGNCYLIKDIIKNATLGNYKVCFDLIQEIDNEQSKTVLTDHLQNYDFDKIIELLNQEKEEKC